MSCQAGCRHHVHTPDALTTMLANRVANNQSALWGSFGPTGSGKSEGNIIVALEIQSKLHSMGLLRDPSLDIRRQVAFKPIHRKPLAQALPKYKVVLDDEATGEGGHKHRTMSTANVDNAQDVDAMRGRCQPCGFAAPYMKRLADPIVDHLLGYLEWHPDHSFEWFEAIRGGDQWNPTVFWQSRFTVEAKDAPNLEQLAPKIRKDYLKAKDDHMHGRNPNAADEVILEDRAYSILKLTNLAR